MLHRRPAQSVNRKAGSSPSHLACPATTVRRLTTPCRKVHVAAAAASGADADVAEPAAQAPSAAAAAAEQPASTATSSSSSSPLGERSTIIRISSRTDATKTAAYITATLAELGPSTVLRVSAVGPGAILAALKTLARAGELTAERAPGKVLTLEPRHRMLRAMQPPAASSSSSSSSAQGDEDQQQQQQQQQQPGTLSTQEWFVRQEPAELFSTEQPEDAPPLNPMRVRADTEYSKVAEHACRLARRASEDATHAVAAFGLYPGREFMQRAKVLVSGLSTARQQLLKDGHPGFTLTLQRTLVEVQRRVQQQDGAEDAGQQRQQQQQDKDGSSDAGATETQLRPSFVVRLYPTPARANANGAPRRGAGGYRRSSDGDGSSSSSSGRRRSARPGFVEVPAAEWAALREQLEVVPGLTQQLQTMTRQHEQLLGLLAAQQQQQGGEGQAAAAAAAAAPEAVQQQQA
ncbi:hypothetical protein OEZ85_002326 [Tetradesmus obliquus]|uniref:DNA/RNA-binding protein Alba-like domain-containing protein n=1 Tax=Tetradesmus obliquus TaxID=3088 RepID=A0ABY8U2T5_TETOB|nr:hypothetical protein OEZ85_002326 [Tetradesmus obliquus]